MKIDAELHVEKRLLLAILEYWMTVCLLPTDDGSHRNDDC
jgi:hypothetical protein